MKSIIRSFDATQSGRLRDRVSLRPDASIAGRLAPPGHGQMVYVLARIGIRASFTNNARVIAIVGLTFMVLLVC